MSVREAIGLADQIALPLAGKAAASPFAALAAGDETALRVAYRDHHAPVRAFARRLVGDDAAAEDLVHEVFVQLPAASRRFRGHAALRTLLMAMTINHARHHVRAAARRRAAAERMAGEGHAPDSTAPDPAERRELAAALMRALDALPLDQRVAFVLCEVEERTSAEAASIAGTSDGTMRARLLLARRRLRAQLTAWGYGASEEQRSSATNRNDRGPR